ncbi:DUF5931 domain-containing protein [Ammonicoccus fulvus]|uniref:DUF5931 domain-containing protein n=1 Tax=Ammonicoccus fulvus TaxID=3138240 RepID=A0ABZ3FUV5_9ACTN
MKPGIQVAIETPLFRVVAWMRWVLLALTLMVHAARFDEVRRPGLVLVAAFVMIVWSGVAHWAYAEPQRRTPWLIGIDFFFAAVPCALSPLILGQGHAIAITGFWAAAPPLALAVLHGWLAGGVAAFLLSALVLIQNPTPPLEVFASTVGLIVGTAVLGFLADQLRDLTCERDRLSAESALLSERQRLSRIVHDGVLQVLTMVEREGPNLGPRGQLLARLAREQESQLRVLIRDAATDPSRLNLLDATQSDLATTIDRHTCAVVTVAVPAEPVLMETARVSEIDAAVREALTNVVKHAGPEARAWVLLEVEGGDVVVSIRDNGVGGEMDDFAAAMRAGRLGVKHSIYGRIHDLGGLATLRTAPGRGVEWEFRVPIEPVRAKRRKQMPLGGSGGWSDEEGRGDVASRDAGGRSPDVAGSDGWRPRGRWIRDRRHSPDGR